MTFEEWYKNIPFGWDAIRYGKTVMHGAFEAGRKAGQEGLIRGFCCWCDKPVPPDTGGLDHGDLHCDGCE